MLPDDRFQAQLAPTIAGILAWSGFVRDWAVVTYADEPASFSFAMQPLLPACCPIALVLFRATQTFSLTLGQESYESLPVPSVDLFPKLVEAVAGGNVVERHYLARATGLPVAIEMRAGPADRPLVAETRWFGASPGSREAVEWRDRHFLPYSRGGAVPCRFTRR